MFQYYLDQIPNKAESIQLLRTAFKWSDAFSLTAHGYSAAFSPDSLKNKELPTGLKTAQLKMFNTENWFCYTTPYNIPRYLFSLRQTSIDWIEESFSDLFSGDHSTRDTFQFADICFFKEAELILGTVSHESICNLITKDMDCQKEFNEIMEWSPIPSHIDARFTLRI